MADILAFPSPVLPQQSNQKNQPKRKAVVPLYVLVEESKGEGSEGSRARATGAARVVGGGGGAEGCVQVQRQRREAGGRSVASLNRRTNVSDVVNNKKPT